MSIPDGLDRIDLRGLAAHGHHGVFDEEKKNGQTFVVDVSLGLDLGPAAREHDLTKTVHYGVLAQQIHDEIVSDPVDLIETLALRMVDLCLAEESVQWASVTVHKPEAPIAVTFEDVAVTIERSKL
ncbi:dihydroneopterin aldolase [Aeromicrobium fastidiosum]|uniref:7,8-dihydroneopterin aldolase n=1 Tax=Aeromicrobium fastidiosum TaxID=52699 RepID=A0A641APU9_9ACTN|nr:dihydroneopterin aldolase [Aeromicrobium fastidiosum]KAA1379965.1 dihydroneopterin aldolase [Aeromicrobium fastidiosum]